MEAFELANEIHGEQRRAGTDIPFMAHLLVVTGHVLADGGDEEETVAALLHDAVEDGAGQPMLDLIEERFGARVASIVEGCSDTIDATGEKEPWTARKRRYLAHLSLVEDDGILRVSLADKVDNVRTLVGDYRREGHALWERIASRNASQQLWYYRRLVAFFEENRPGPLSDDLRQAVEEFSTLVMLDGAVRGLFEQPLQDFDAPPD